MVKNLTFDSLKLDTILNKGFEIYDSNVFEMTANLVDNSKIPYEILSPTKLIKIYFIDGKWNEFNAPILKNLKVKLKTPLKSIIRGLSSVRNEGYRIIKLNKITMDEPASGTNRK